MHDYQAPADLLKDRIVMVTGAGSGIGRAAAKAYAAHGATVVLVGRTVSKLETVYDEIEAAGHPKPAIVPMRALLRCQRNEPEIRSAFACVSTSVKCFAVVHMAYRRFSVRVCK